MKLEDCGVTTSEEYMYITPIITAVSLFRIHFHMARTILEISHSLSNQVRISFNLANFVWSPPAICLILWCILSIDVLLSGLVLALEDGRRYDGLAIEKRERRDGGFGMEMMERRGGGFAMEKRERRDDGASGHVCHPRRLRRGRPESVPILRRLLLLRPLPPFSDFFNDIMHTYGFHLLDFTPNSVACMALLAHLCEGFVGVHPNKALFRHYFHPRI